MCVKCLQGRTSSSYPIDTNAIVSMLMISVVSRKKVALALLSVLLWLPRLPILCSVVAQTGVQTGIPLSGGRKASQSPLSLRFVVVARLP